MWTAGLHIICVAFARVCASVQYLVNACVSLCSANEKGFRLPSCLLYVFALELHHTLIRTYLSKNCVGMPCTVVHPSACSSMKSSCIPAIYIDTSEHTDSKALMNVHDANGCSPSVLCCQCALSVNVHLGVESNMMAAAHCTLYFVCLCLVCLCLVCLCLVCLCVCSGSPCPDTGHGSLHCGTHMAYAQMW